MDFTNVKLFTNPLRQDMSTNVKYFSTGGCYSNSKFFKNDLESISSHLLKLTTKFPNLNGGFGSDFHEQRMTPTIISLKNVIIQSLPLNNIYANLTTDLMNATTNMTTPDTNVDVVMSQFNNLSQTDLTDFDNIDLRKSLSPKRFYNNQQLQMKVKHMKKSPNLMFYRNLIEEIAAERKMVGKILPRNDEAIGAVSTPSFVIIENAKNSTSLIGYEIRFQEAKRKKLPQKIFQKCTDNAAKFAEPINILELENESHNQISPSNCYKQKTSTKKGTLESGFEMINLENELMRADDGVDESDDDDSFIQFGDSSDDDDDEEDDESSDSDNDNDEDDNNITTVNGKNNNVRSVTTCTTLLSDCDSEDSFIVFGEDDDNDDDTNDQNRMSLIEEEDSGDESDIYTEDEPDCGLSPPRLKQIQILDDESMLEKSTEKKVHFKPDTELCMVHPMVQWRFAYEKARKGLWEEAARDRCRFQSRLRRMGDILKPILTTEHRNNIYTERFQEHT